MRAAPNFNVPPGVNISGYARPRIDRVTHRPITVNTSLGPRAATEVTIVGEHFASRAVDPAVMVNALPLVRFLVANDTRSITGYLFEPLHRIAHVAVDYGLGARGEWSPARPSRALLWLLIILILILLAILLLWMAVSPTVVTVLLGVAALVALLALLMAS